MTITRYICVACDAEYSEVESCPVCGGDIVEQHDDINDHSERVSETERSYDGTHNTPENGVETERSYDGTPPDSDESDTTEEGLNTSRTGENNDNPNTESTNRSELISGFCDLIRSIDITRFDERTNITTTYDPSVNRSLDDSSDDLSEGNTDNNNTDNNDNTTDNNTDNNNDNTTDNTTDNNDNNTDDTECNICNTESQQRPEYRCSNEGCRARWCNLCNNNLAVRNNQNCPFCRQPIRQVNSQETSRLFFNISSNLSRQTTRPNSNMNLYELDIMKIMLILCMSNLTILVVSNILWICEQIYKFICLFMDYEYNHEYFVAGDNTVNVIKYINKFNVGMVDIIFSIIKIFMSLLHPLKYAYQNNISVTSINNINNNLATETMPIICNILYRVIHSNIELMNELFTVAMSLPDLTPILDRLSRR